MAMAQTTEAAHRSGEEVCRLGDEIYEREIRALVEAEHQDHYLVIDVDSGAWAVAEEEIDASRRLDELQPDAHNVYGMRVGHATLRYFGFSPPRPAE